MVTNVKKSKVRLLTKTLAVVSLLAPTGGHSLGIGEIKLHSALNQNLDAEISLTLSGESLSDIKVSLAPPEKFDEAGVSWVYFLSKIKFETITHSNGSAVIKLTSKEALKEPFLDFLLEVSWPKGNLYREFTVLVDPPSIYNQATLPVPTVAENYAQPPVVAPQRVGHANGQSSPGVYGPTHQNDTLWSVAELVSTQGNASVEQMMIAIFEANPQAFYKENVHALMAGKMLKIPESEAVIKLSRNQAIAEFKRHTKDWKNPAAITQTAKEKPVLSAVEEPAHSKSEEPVDNQLTLVAPTKTPVEGLDVVTSVNEDEQKSAGVPGSVPGESVKNVPEGAEQAAVAQADSATQGKIAELEKNLAMMQELIVLKDQQLAALQNQSQVNPVVQEQSAPSEIVAVQAPEQIIPALQSSTVQPVQPSAQPEAVNIVDPYYLGMGGLGATMLTLLGWLWWRKRKVDEETNTESMFASSSFIEMPEAGENYSVLPVEEAAAVHDAGTFGESSFLSEFTPSDFDSFDTDQGEIDPVSEADVYLAYGRYQQAEELIRQAIETQPNRDECKLKLLEIFYANEDKTAFEAYANELAEAGKRNDGEFWEKAAEMGREICPSSPLFSFGADVFVDERQNSEGLDFNLSSFGVESDEADQGVIASSVQLSKVSAMPVENSDFDLSSFSIASDQGVINHTQASTPAATQEEYMDFDLSSFSMESDDGVIASDVQLGKSLETQEENFDLSSFSMESDEAEQGVIAAAPDTQADNFDFDLSSFSLGSEPSDAVSKDSTASDIDSEAQPAKQKLEFETYEFESSSKHAELTAVDDLNFNTLENSEKQDQDIEFSTDSSLDLTEDMDGDFDFNFELDEPKATSGPASNLSDEFGVSDLTDMDELETKLDLAKAYVDMGDADAAKDLAKEVIEQGTSEQKTAAQALLDELG